MIKKKKINFESIRDVAETSEHVSAIRRKWRRIVFIFQIKVVADFVAWSRNRGNGYTLEFRFTSRGAYLMLYFIEWLLIFFSVEEILITLGSQLFFYREACLSLPICTRDQVCLQLLLASIQILLSFLLSLCWTYASES